MTSANPEFPYPETPTVDQIDLLHGERVADPYRWLEEVDSAQTTSWVDAQNELTFGYLERLPARKRIRQRLTELWDFDKYNAPIQRSGRYFFTCTKGLQNQNVLYWMEGIDAEPKILLDPNQLSRDGTIALSGYAISEDGRLLAYGLSSSGSDWQEWKVRQVDSGRDLDDHLRWIKFSGASWDSEGKGFFYSRYDEPEEGKELEESNYFQKLYYHRVGTPQSEDELLYERTDQKEWGFFGQVTDDGRYLAITVWKGTLRENAIFYKDLKEDGDVTELLPNFDARYVLIGNIDRTFYLVTDLKAPLSRLIAVDLDAPDPANWRQVIPEASDALAYATLIGDHLLVTYLHDAHSIARLFDTKGRLQGDIDLPGIGTVDGFSARQTDQEAFYYFTSFTTPGTIYRYDVESRRSAIFRQPDTGFDSEDYATEQIFYQSKDGTRVPMFICRRKDLQARADTPCYLWGYGGFDIAMTPFFSVANLVWMEMGGVYAHANIRGGGEYGKVWHEAGSKLQKQNVFDDFITAAEWLIENEYTSTPKLAIGGGSNGGLLIGACLAQRPDLFGACLPAVGVLDMLRFHKFTIGWAWTSDYGSPDDPEEFKILRAYSPYHNIREGTEYPPTLVTTGDHDDRVFPAHSFKFAAALQTAQAGKAPVLIRVETKAGHGAGKPTTKIIEEAADRWAFLADVLEMELG